MATAKQKGKVRKPRRKAVYHLDPFSGPIYAEYAAVDSTRTKAATKMGASTPSRSRQVAGRERAKVDTSDYSGKIAARVRTLRETASMSVEDLAKNAGIDVKAMYAYEQRTRRIPPEKYPALAKALNCKTPDEFFPPLK